MILVGNRKVVWEGSSVMGSPIPIANPTDNLILNIHERLWWSINIEHFHQCLRFLIIACGSDP